MVVICTQVALTLYLVQRKSESGPPSLLRTRLLWQGKMAASFFHAARIVEEKTPVYSVGGFQKYQGIWLGPSGCGCMGHLLGEEGLQKLGERGGILGQGY